MDHIFRNDWLPLAHVSQIPAAGDFLNIDMLGEPLIVVRGKRTAFRAVAHLSASRDGHCAEGLPADTASAMPKKASRAAVTRGFMCPYQARGPCLMVGQASPEAEDGGLRARFQA